MSQENVEIVRAGFDAWNAEDMDAFAELLAPDVILRVPEGWPEPRPYVGREAVMRQFRQNRDTWDTDFFETTTDYIAIADRVIVRMLWRVAGQGPAPNVEFTGVITVRDGRVRDFEYFWDHARALEAVGLSE